MVVARGVDYDKIVNQVVAMMGDRKTAPVDWQSVARDAAVRIAADNNGVEVSKDWFERYSAYCCDLALALVAEMKRREGFGGGT